MLAAAPVVWIFLYLLGLPLRQSSPSLVTILLIVVTYPVLEEIVFRGAVQGALLNWTALRRSFAGISIACVITSSLFATAHLLTQSAVWATLVFIPSLVFGWARERHKTLYSPILLHMFYNAGFIGIFQTATTP